VLRVLSKPTEGALRREEGFDAAYDAVARWRSGKERTWIDVQAATPDEVDFLLWELNFEDLSLEDATRPDTPPKAEEVGEQGSRAAYLLVIARSPLKGGPEGSEGVALLLRPGLLVTVHTRPSARVDSAMARVERDPSATIGKGIELAAYALLDEFVEGYQPVLADFDHRIEQLEEAILARRGRREFEAILRLRRDIAQVWRDVRPMRDLLASLAREGHPLIKAKARVALRDLYDHTQRALDRLENDRESVASLRDAHLSLENNRMNEVMRALTVVSAVGGALAVITGVFGMNFTHIPGLDSPAGFWATIGGMVVLSVTIVALFRLKRWV